MITAIQVYCPAWPIDQRARHVAAFRCRKPLQFPQSIYTSNSDNLQVGFDRRLTELWTVSALVGYSKSTDQYRSFSTILDTHRNLEWEQTAVYSVNLVRQVRVVACPATCLPSVYANRVRLPIAPRFSERAIGYNYSERWTFGVGVTWANIANPVLTGGSARAAFTMATFRRIGTGPSSGSLHSGCRKSRSNTKPK